jgi:hypothetical protein
VQVYWRNKTDDAEIVGAKKSSKQSDFSQWMPITPIIGGLSFNDQFAVAQWDNSKHMRLYYTSDKTSLLEVVVQAGFPEPNSAAISNENHSPASNAFFSVGEI